jgi:hypothetical protein
MIPQKGQDKYNRLRSKYQCFIFDKFDINLTNNILELQYFFSIDNKIFFKPKIEINIIEDYQNGNLKMNHIENIAFNIGMVELISYWKAACPQKTIIKAGKLNKSQIDFFKKLYFNGLGEFFYINGISTDIESFMEIESESYKTYSSFEISTENKNLIPVGGGKDSVVSLEILKNSKSDNFSIIINPRQASLKTNDIAGLDKKLIKVIRQIDPELIELNKKSFLNGHTPFSAIVAFVSLMSAYLHNIKYIALSNESSANESTVSGTNINHQYSKSYEFESNVRDYIFENITKNIEYFSLLRPLSELQIAAIFSNLKKYHQDFRSCNVGSKEDKWCGNCPKCLFTFIILSPFLSIAEIENIFGKNLLDDKNLEKDFDELVGIADIKPFECVGTVDEVRIALSLSFEKYKVKPYLLKRFENLGLQIEFDKKELIDLNSENFLSENYLNLIKSNLEKII